MPQTTVQGNKNSINGVMKRAFEQSRSSFQPFKEGDIAEGPIITKEGSAVYIDLGIRGTGVIYGREYYEAQDKLKEKKKGDNISAKIIELENKDGLRELSLAGARRETSWQKLSSMRDSKELVSVNYIWYIKRVVTMLRILAIFVIF